MSNPFPTIRSQFPSIPFIQLPDHNLGVVHPPTHHLSRNFNNSRVIQKQVIKHRDSQRNHHRRNIKPKDKPIQERRVRILVIQASKHDHFGREEAQCRQQVQIDINALIVQVEQAPQTGSRRTRHGTVAPHNTRILAVPIRDFAARHELSPNWRDAGRPTYRCRRIWSLGCYSESFVRYERLLGLECGGRWLREMQVDQVVCPEGVADDCEGDELRAATDVVGPAAWGGHANGDFEIRGVLSSGQNLR